MDLEQYFLNLQDDKLEKIILNTIEKIKINRIIELGAGKGDFTKTFMNSGLESLCYEIDSNLEHYFYENTTKNCEFILKDLTDDIYIDRDDIIISAPPYSLLKFIKEKYIEPNNIRYILMVSERLLPLFEEAKIIYILEGSEFIPVSNGKHYIITNL